VTGPIAADRAHDVVVIGAGMVGAACAYYLAQAGMRVAVVDRGSVAGGTTGAGEGNILVSDKEAGPELDLALLSNRLWRELADDLGPAIDLEPKGGLVVAATAAAATGLDALARAQRQAGVDTQPVDPAGLRQLEPHLADGLVGGVYYPQDMQVQPMMAAAQLLRRAQEMGAEMHLHEEVTGFLTGPGPSVQGVRTARGTLAAGIVVNAAGTWAGEIAALAGVALPILPRRGFIIVTEAVPQLIRHKVYGADYVANVSSSDAALETSAVVEGTAAGNILIGASRERVGFDRTPSPAVIGRLAAQAVALFPVLAEIRAVRYYRGFRPYCPDHLPVIGGDPRMAGLVHACGHEGAGIGLAPATGRLVSQLAACLPTSLLLEPFDAARFDRSPTEGVHV
jgi:glycine/D-amino acid oxidase-like deaminating enzyme